jgi:hypothetical protein
MEDTKLFKATCIRNCFDGGAYDRKRLEEAGVNFKEERGEFCHQYYFGQLAEIDPRNPIAIHFQFEKDPQIAHKGYHFDDKKMQYIADNPVQTQAELDRKLADLRSEEVKLQHLKAEQQLLDLKDKNEKLRKEVEARKREKIKEAPISEAQAVT